jgi:predicted nuclease of predicted toxin-antitoxin system
MKPVFLANENFPRQSIILLKNAGFDVLSVAEQSPGITDSEVLAQACREGMVILTFDRDYGELLFKYRQSKPDGVIYFRTGLEHPEQAGRVLLGHLHNSLEIKGYFTVVGIHGVRQRPL